jgi:hypothetical protein
MLGLRTTNSILAVATRHSLVTMTAGVPCGGSSAFKIGRGEILGGGLMRTKRNPWLLGFDLYG